MKKSTVAFGLMLAILPAFAHADEAKKTETATAASAKKPAVTALKKSVTSTKKPESTPAKKSVDKTDPPAVQQDTPRNSDSVASAKDAGKKPAPGMHRRPNYVDGHLGRPILAFGTTGTDTALYYDTAQSTDATTPENAADTKSAPDKTRRPNYVGARLGRSNLSLTTTSDDISRNYNLNQSVGAFGYGATVGRWFGKSWRLEAEVDRVGANTNLKQIYEKDSFSATTVMGNFYYNFSGIEKLYPYIGFGLGVSDMSMEFNLTDVGQKFKGSDTNFAFQFIAGFGFILTDRIDLDVGWRGRFMGSVKNPNVYGTNYYTDATASEFYITFVWKW